MFNLYQNMRKGSEKKIANTTEHRPFIANDFDKEMPVFDHRLVDTAS